MVPVGSSHQACDVGVVCLSVDGDGLAAAGVRETAHTLDKFMLAG